MNLKQYGGEGTESYKSSKTDMKYPQHGGEGSTVSKMSGPMLNKGMSGPEYCGPGKYLGKSK